MLESRLRAGRNVQTGQETRTALRFDHGAALLPTGFVRI